MIDPKRAYLPIIRQCTLLHLNRSGIYYRPVPQSGANLDLMRLIDAQFLQAPYYVLWLAADNMVSATPWV